MNLLENARPSQMRHQNTIFKGISLLAGQTPFHRGRKAPLQLLREQRPREGPAVQPPLGKPDCNCDPLAGLILLCCRGRGGFCRKNIFVKNKFEFLTLFGDTFPKKAQLERVFYNTTPLLDQTSARTRRSKTCPKYPTTRVHRCASSGKHAGNEGQIHTHAPVPTMPRK